MWFFKSIWEGLEVLNNRWMYGILVVVVCLLTYFTLPSTLHVPATFTDYMVYYFQNPKEYFSLMIRSFISFLGWMTLGLSTIYNLMSWNEEVEVANWVFWTVVGFGVILCLISFYFLAQSLILLVVLLIMGAVIYFIFSGKR